MKDSDLCLFNREEAGKQWQRRQEQWHQDQQFRDNLMKEVIQQRQEQINEKLTILKQQQKQIEKERQTLIDDMEQADRYHRIEQVKQEKQKQENKQDLERQVKGNLSLQTSIKDISSFFADFHCATTTTTNSTTNTTKRRSSSRTRTTIRAIRRKTKGSDQCNDSSTESKKFIFISLIDRWCIF